MLIEQALHDALLADATVTGLVGERVYYGKAKQDTVSPYIVITKQSAPRMHSHDGASGLVNARFTFEIYAVSYLSVKTIAAAIQSVLQGYSGTMGGAGGVYVNGCFYEDETDLSWELESDLHGLAVNYRLWHQE